MKNKIFTELYNCFFYENDDKIIDCVNEKLLLTVDYDEEFAFFDRYGIKHTANTEDAEIQFTGQIYETINASSNRITHFLDDSDEIQFENNFYVLRETERGKYGKKYAVIYTNTKSGEIEYYLYRYTSYYAGDTIPQMQKIGNEEAHDDFNKLIQQYIF